MKTKLSFILDVAFVSAISFTLALVAFNYFIPYPFTLIYSACVSAISTIIFFSLTDKKNKAERLKRAEQKECEFLISELNFSERQEQNDVIENALKKRNIPFERKRAMFFIKDNNAVVICRFGFNNVAKSDVVRAFNAITKKQKAYILAESFDADVIAFAERFDGRIELINGNKVYKFLKESDAMPNFKYKEFSERKKKGDFKNLLDKKKAKTFFAFGLVFLLTSYFSPLQIYYLVCGCLFLIYSLVLRLMGKEINLKVAQTDNI